MATNDALSPELLRIIKIFGAVSVGLVLLLSLFNDRKADNTGSMDEFFVTDANRIYFKNLRQHNYDWERHHAAKMDIFRYEKRVTDTSGYTLNAALIINRVKDAAYLYLEPQGRLKHENPLEIRWEKSPGDKGKSSFYQGDRYSHYQFVEEIFPLLNLDEPVAVEAKVGDSWIPILTSTQEIDALRITCKDYYRLIGRE
ncbi:hypothetical protein [Lunatibacter salilacus]|uniref:hypothetical protein n=1 Tax=Lunatibacter salilacus TaxID=2483804 RepID=UPI00131B1940|nr:hypothetical protein [Lunatibacter salilacus]